jgi:cytochrome c nitrite reductase small subunit
MISIGAVVGLVVGLGLYTFVYARGYSYLTNNPAACANCHVMEEYYAGWMKSGHAAVATCNDCHTPHDPIGKYAIKAANGFRHSLAFTTGRFPENIRIAGYNERVTEGACKACHGELTASMRGTHGGSDVSCVRCHFDVGHSAAPFAFTAALPSPMAADARSDSNNEGR